MSLIKKIDGHIAVRHARKRISEGVEAIIDQAIAVQQIPAPTFAEVNRAAYIQNRFVEIGLIDVLQDKLNNVYGRLPGTSPQTHKPVVVSAHSDTVFPTGTDLTIRRDGRYVRGPGIGDNSTGVAGIICLAQQLQAMQIAIPADIWIVSNVCEEGLGDLRGMRAVVERFGTEPTYLVVEGGLFGQISHQAIGVRRYRIQVKTAGGHSWGSFGNSSAIHVLGQIIAAVDKMKVPIRPKTTFNVGVIEGGTSINTIAQSASMLLDLRSEAPEALGMLVEDVQKIVQKIQKKLHQNGRSDVTITMELIGDRPAGMIGRRSTLVLWAKEALNTVGCRSVTFVASSTDANIPLSKGLRAVCIGLTESNNAHRLDEYMDPQFLPDGLSQLLLLTLASAGFEG